MIDEDLIKRAEVLRTSVESLKKELRGSYSTPTSQVDGKTLQRKAAQVAESWLIGIAGNKEVEWALDPETWSDMNLQFQRLLTCSEHATIRKKYDSAIAAIMKDYRARVVIPLRQRQDQPFGPTAKAQHAASTKIIPLRSARSVFLAHSFAPEDEGPKSLLERLLRALSLEVKTGERPRAESISEKVKKRIVECDAFVAVFTKRDKLAGKNEWTTSPWLIEEKIYAFTQNKRLVLLREEGVGSIGGLMGDQELIRFKRADMGEALVKVVEMFKDPEDGGK